MMGALSVGTCSGMVSKISVCVATSVVCPQVRLELCVSLLPWQSVSEEKTSQVVDRIAWLCTPMNRDLDAGTHDSADRPSFSPELLGSAFHRRASV